MFCFDSVFYIFFNYRHSPFFANQEHTTYEDLLKLEDESMRSATVNVVVDSTRPSANILTEGQTVVEATTNLTQEKPNTGTVKVFKQKQHHTKVLQQQIPLLEEVKNKLNILIFV